LDMAGGKKMNLSVSSLYSLVNSACPGRHLAETTLWTTIALLLTSFDITLPVDANKQPIMPDLEYESSVAVR
jgi:hypothetical protein